MRRLGDQVQVNVQLIDAESGAHVWADRFETDRRNLVEAQSEITGRLARTLNLELMGAAPFAAGSDELNDVEYFLSYLSNGLPLRANVSR